MLAYSSDPTWLLSQHSKLAGAVRIGTFSVCYTRMLYKIITVNEEAIDHEDTCPAMDYLKDEGKPKIMR